MNTVELSLSMKIKQKYESQKSCKAVSDYILPKGIFLKIT